jgi:hypothetical protein
MSGEML